MAFAQLAARQGGSAVTGSVYSVALPSSISAGQLLIAKMFVKGALGAATFPAGWNAFGGTNNGSDYFTPAYRFADGTETSPISVTGAASGNHHATWDVERWTGAHASTPPEAGTGVAASTANPNPPSLTPSWGTEDTLFEVLLGITNGSRTVSSYPTNYASNQNVQLNSDAADVAVISASRELNGSSDDPGTFTLSGSTTTLVQTIAIRPGVVLPTAEYSASQTLDDATVSATLTFTSQYSESQILDDVTQVATIELGAAYNEAVARFKRGGGEYRRVRVRRNRIRH